MSENINMPPEPTDGDRIAQIRARDDIVQRMGGEGSQTQAAIDRHYLLAQLEARAIQQTMYCRRPECSAVGQVMWNGAWWCKRHAPAEAQEHADVPALRAQLAAASAERDVIDPPTTDELRQARVGMGTTDAQMISWRYWHDKHNEALQIVTAMAQENERLQEALANSEDNAAMWKKVAEPDAPSTGRTITVTSDGMGLRRDDHGSRIEVYMPEEDFERLRHFHVRIFGTRVTFTEPPAPRPDDAQPSLGAQPDAPFRAELAEKSLAWIREQFGQDVTPSFLEGYIEHHTHAAKVTADEGFPLIAESHEGKAAAATHALMVLRRSLSDANAQPDGDV